MRVCANEARLSAEYRPAINDLPYLRRHCAQHRQLAPPCSPRCPPKASVSGPIPGSHTSPKEPDPRRALGVEIVSFRFAITMIDPTNGTAQVNISRSAF